MKNLAMLILAALVLLWTAPCSTIAQEAPLSPWVKVTGKMSFRKEGNQTVPVIEGSTIEQTTAPENAMISQ